MTVARPLAAYPAFRATSAEAAASEGEKILGPHTVRLVQTDKDGIAAEVNALRLRDVTLGYFRYGAELLAESRQARPFYAVNVPLSGCMIVEHDGQRIAARRDAAVVVAPVGPVRMHWAADLSVLSVMIARSSLERCLSAMLCRPVDGVIEFDTRMPVADKAGWWAIVGMVLGLVDDGHGASPPLVVAELEHSIMTTLLISQPHDYTSLLLDQPVEGARQIVDEAVSFMRKRHEADISVATVARAVGVAERTLQVAFRRWARQSPGACLRDIRLDEARRTLMATSARNITISRVAAECGLGNLGRFSAAYQARFGEKPSQTPRRG